MIFFLSFLADLLTNLKKVFFVFTTMHILHSNNFVSKFCHQHTATFYLFIYFFSKYIGCLFYILYISNFGTRDWFCGRPFFHRPWGGGCCSFARSATAHRQLGSPVANRPWTSTGTGLGTSDIDNISS